MRALRILLIVVVILGVLFVVVDRVAVHFAEGQVADKLKSTENLNSTPDVSIAATSCSTVTGRVRDQSDWWPPSGAKG